METISLVYSATIRFLGAMATVMAFFLPFLISKQQDILFGAMQITFCMVFLCVSAWEIVKTKPIEERKKLYKISACCIALWSSLTALILMFSLNEIIENLMVVAAFVIVDYWLWKMGIRHPFSICRLIQEMQKPE